MFQTCHSFFNIFACSRHCHEDWYWLSRTLHSRRFFMSRSLFEKNQKIILIKLAWTSPTRRASPASLIHPLWLQGTILFEELWQKKEKKSLVLQELWIMHPECNETEKKRSFFWILQCSYGKIGRKETFVMCSPFPQKVAENEGSRQDCCYCNKKNTFL